MSSQALFAPGTAGDMMEQEIRESAMKMALQVDLTTNDEDHLMQMAQRIATWIITGKPDMNQHLFIVVQYLDKMINEDIPCSIDILKELRNLLI